MMRSSSIYLYVQMNFPVTCILQRDAWLPGAELMNFQNFIQYLYVVLPRNLSLSQAEGVLCAFFWMFSRQTIEASLCCLTGRGDNIVVQDAQVVVVLVGQSCGEYRVSTLIPIVTDRCGGW